MSKKRALLVGINYPGTKHALRGCVNDVQLMNQVITTYHGFTKPKDKRMLTDASATTRNILDRLEWLVDGATPGDVLYFHYSGHGSQLVDTNYDNDVEPDGLDEIICPIDLNWRDKVIKDDDFKRIFDSVPSGVNLTVVLDCCHSGGGIDTSSEDYQIRSIIADPDTPIRNRLLEMPADIANRAFGTDLKVKPRAAQTSNDGQGLLISGCRSNQTSADAWIHNRFIGAATYFLASTLKRHDQDITYNNLVREMNRRLTSRRYSQRPELNGPSDLHNNKFLSPLI